MKQTARIPLATLAALAALLGAAEASAQSSWLWYPHDADQTRSRSYTGGHPAIDFAASCGTAVYASADGVVTRAISSGSCRVCYDCYSGCGNSYVDGGCKNNLVYIDHPNGHQTRYLHLQAVGVSEGQEVSAGQYIGDVGNVGWTCGATGCHLHFELKNGANASIDPDAGHWTDPLRYGGDTAPPGDNEAPVCSFPSHPGTGVVLKDGAQRVEWAVTDGGGSNLRGTAQSWDAPIDAGSDPQFDSGGQQRHDGYLEVSWAGPGKHTAFVRGWDNAGNTCQADMGEFWYYPEPFEREFLLAGPLAEGGGGRDRVDELPIGPEADLMPRPGDAAGPTTWQTHLDEDDFVDLDAVIGGDDRLAYAMTWCYNPGGPREVDLHVGSDDGFKLVVNGQEAARVAEPRAAEPDQDSARVSFAPGYNRVLLKVEDKGGGWGFYLRVADPDDPYALTDIDCVADFTTGPCGQDAHCPGDWVCEAGRCARPSDPPANNGDPVNNDTPTNNGDPTNNDAPANNGDPANNGADPSGDEGGDINVGDTVDGEGDPSADGEPMESNVVSSSTCAQGGAGGGRAPWAPLAALGAMAAALLRRRRR